jgi:hypothetical protein
MWGVGNVVGTWGQTGTYPVFRCQATELRGVGEHPRLTSWVGQLGVRARSLAPNHKHPLDTVAENPARFDC